MSAQDGRGFVTYYARTNLFEDFTESYATRVRDPTRLRFYNPLKYEFMKNEVFHGREYPPPDVPHRPP